MKSLELADRKIATENAAFVLGIVNITPDSFYSGSRGGLERALQLIEEGADILDLGAESTRPGADYIPDEEQIKRLVPVVRALRKKSDIPISIDTRKLSVLRAAFDEGADILNDVAALEDDEKLAEFAADKKIPVILMHKRGIPAIMQKDTGYENVRAEVDRYLKERAAFAEACGIAPEKIIVDPGVGFGKNLDGNISLLKNCSGYCGGKYQVLIGLSRKSFLGELTGRAVQDRLAATLAANMLAAQGGADFLRVHDVKETLDMLKVLRHWDTE